MGRYLATCSSGQWAPINQQCCFRFPSAYDKAASSLNFSDFVIFPSQVNHTQLAPVALASNLRLP